jgi:hypothetical protein
VAELLDRPSVKRSTLSVWSVGPQTGVAEGEVFFSMGIKLRVMEELDFEAELITAYGYEVYRHGEKLYWYDDYPHPNDPDLAATHPHHKHVSPDIKHNRVAAPRIEFSRPNLAVLIAEVEEDLLERERHIE